MKTIAAQLDEVIESGSPLGKLLRVKKSQMAAYARTKEFASALSALNEIRKALSRPEEADGKWQSTWDRAKEGWRKALGTVDSQLKALATVLKSYRNADLDYVAHEALDAMTRIHRAAMLSALKQVDSAVGADRNVALGKLDSVIERVLRSLNEEEAIAVCDANPFGVSVSIRKTLNGALESLRQLTSGAA